MLSIILFFIIGIIACYFIAKVIIKFVPKIQPIVSLLLWAAIIWLGYISYQSVMKPIQFNAEKTKRYTKVVKSLKVIRDAQAEQKSNWEICQNW